MQCWLCEVESASWAEDKDVLAEFRRVELLPNNRVIFHCNNGEYKLLVMVVYVSGIIIIEKIGTTTEYSKWNLK